MKNKAKKGATSLGTMCTFMKGRACSDTLFNVLSSAFDLSMELEERAVQPLAGGIKQYGYQCGMLWGATLAAGAEAYRLYGPGPKAETRAIMAAKRLVESFQRQNIHINCLEITDIDKSSSKLKMLVYFLVKGGTIGCIRRAGSYAPRAYQEINTAFSEKTETVPCNPASCAAMMAKKAGLSEKHAVMTAGLAGGIGLCGGACGALGAAVWIMGLKLCKAREIKNLWGDKEFNTKFNNLMDRFIKTTDYQFECLEITGRKFEKIEDHATYLRKGGCAEVIAMLAEACQIDQPGSKLDQEKHSVTGDKVTHEYTTQ